MPNDDRSSYQPEPDNCPKDLDQDGVIGLGDILALLGDYGATCPE